MIVETSGVDRLAAEWPQTHQVLVRAGWLGHDGGYYLTALRRMAAMWDEKHGHRHVPRAAIDGAAAGEVRYHFEKGRRFRRPCSALWVCWLRLVVERPERVLWQAGGVGEGSDPVKYPRVDRQKMGYLG